MATLARTTASYRLFWRAFAEWRAQDAPVLIYMAKAAIAGLLALSVSMILNLPDPRTAIFTSFIVMQPQSGLVFSKSYYRILGTVAGVAVSLALMGMFAQEREWFIALFALWIAITTAAGLKYRNFQSYGFVLAGYTVCIVALPVIEMPLEVFDIATSRFSEVLVGILAATLVSDLIFPRHLSDSLLAAERERFHGVLKSLSNTDALLCGGAATGRFASGVVGLNATQINTAFEGKNDRKARQHYQHLNMAYMNLSTTYHSLRTLLARNNGQDQLLEGVGAIYAPIASALAELPEMALESEDLAVAVATLEALKRSEEALIERERQKLGGDTQSDFDAAAHLLKRLLRELHHYCVTYLSLLRHRRFGDSSEELSRTVRFKTHTDPVLVALAAARGASVLLAGMAFWILSGWYLAPQSIMLSVVITLLIATLPNPLDTIINFFKGGVAAIAFAAVYDFYLIPRFASDLFSLCLILFPVLALIAWWTTRPKWGGFALGFIFMFMYQSALDPRFKMTVTFFLENALANLIGIIFAGLAYYLINFWSLSWTQRRVAEALRGRIVMVCDAPLSAQRSSLESTARDMVQQFSTHGRLNERSSARLFEWLLSTLEIGRGVIAIRRQLERGSVPHDSARRALEALRAYFSAASEAEYTILKRRLDVALYELREALKNEGNSQRIRALADELSLIRLLVSDPEALPVIKEK
ncbi:FUSC family protein [Sulfuricurvum sp. UBA5598]|uniref:FUSC family protein n=1 Tax=Sulfuricurvum sp. UBA5598 TaxID=1947586 RepID=UPI0025DED9E4|nr:FUSC family protein [Sulfuricurvum sp. UBA5598]